MRWILFTLCLSGCTSFGWGDLEVTLQNLQATPESQLQVELSQAQNRASITLSQSELTGGRSFVVHAVIARSTDLRVQVLSGGKLRQSGSATGVLVEADRLTTVLVTLDNPPVSGCTAKTPRQAGDGCCPPGATHAEDPDCCLVGTLESTPLGAVGKNPAIAAGAAGQFVAAYLHEDRLHGVAPPAAPQAIDTLSQVSGLPAAAIKPDGTAVIVYLDKTAKRLRLASGRGGGAWNQQVIAENVSITSAPFVPNVGVDTAGEVHVSYLDGLPPRSPHYATSRDGWKMRTLALRQDITGDKLAMAVRGQVHFCHYPEGNRWLEYARLDESGLHATPLSISAQYDIASCVIDIDAAERPHLFYSQYTTYVITYGTIDASGTWRFSELSKITRPYALRIRGDALHLVGAAANIDVKYLWRPIESVTWSERQLTTKTYVPLVFDVDASGEGHAVYVDTSTGEGNLQHLTVCPGLK